MFFDERKGPDVLGFENPECFQVPPKRSQAHKSNLHNEPFLAITSKLEAIAGMWRPWLLGWRPSLSGWRPLLLARLEAIPIRLEPIASKSP